MLITFPYLPKQALQLFLVLILFSCSEPRKIEGFNSAAWKNDPYGCKGERARIWKEFASRKTEMMGYKENDLKFLMGKAEKIHLPDKGQRIYYYFISGSPKCGMTQDQTPVLLQIRVNATNNVSEVLLITSDL